MHNLIAHLPHAHAVSLVQTRTGLMAAWFLEPSLTNKHPASGIELSRWNGVDWSRACSVVPPPLAQAEYAHLSCWNPVLYSPGVGDLYLFYKIGTQPRTWEGWLAHSQDEGVSWMHRPLGNGPPGALVGPTRNHPLVLSDGALLCPASTENARWRCHFERSHDLLTWQVIGPVDDPLQLDAIQPALLDLGHGRLLALCRCRRRVVGQTQSEDEGRTWSPLALTGLPNPNSAIDALRLHDGRFLLAYNPSNRNRWPLSLAVSEDGVHWEALLDLESGPGECAYPSLIQDQEGIVHIAYSYRRLAIVHAQYDPIKGVLLNNG